MNQFTRNLAAAFAAFAIMATTFVTVVTVPAPQTHGTLIAIPAVA